MALKSLKSWVLVLDSYFEIYGKINFLKIRLFVPYFAPSLCNVGLCMRRIDRNANRLQNVCLCQDSQDGLWPIWPGYYHSIALLQMLQFWARLKLTAHSITEHSTVRPFALYSPVTLWYIETMNIVQVQVIHYKSLTVSTPKGGLGSGIEIKVVVTQFIFGHQKT